MYSCKYGVMWSDCDTCDSLRWPTGCRSLGPLTVKCTNMKIHEKSMQKSMKIHANPWKIHENPWTIHEQSRKIHEKSMKIHEKSMQQSMKNPWKIHENPWKINENQWTIHENPWTSMKNPWKSMKNQWKSMNNPGKSMKIYEHPWKIHENPWKIHENPCSPSRGCRWPTWRVIFFYPKIRCCMFYVLRFLCAVAVLGFRSVISAVASELNAILCNV